jgi:transcriptional regulator with XRE-family HTH domain
MAIRFGDGLLDKLMRERARQFGPVVAHAMKQLGFSQYEVAQRGNIGPVTLNRIVRGHRPPTEAQALRIAAAFMAPRERQVASWVLEMAGFDPLGMVRDAEQRDGDKKRPVLLGQ